MINLSDGTVKFDDGLYLYPFMDVANLIYKGVIKSGQRKKKSVETSEPYVFDGMICNVTVHIKNEELYKIYLFLTEQKVKELNVAGEYPWGKIYFHEEEPEKLIIKFIKQK